MDDIWDNIATSLSTREKWKQKVADKADILALYKHNRLAAEQMDNVFRLGLFMDSMEKGYTIKGARERVETYFYDFKDMPSRQRDVSRLLPFTSFAMKTVESVADRAAKLDFTAVTIPHYANKVLNGAYVDSYEDRKFLQASLPPWAQDQVLGPALPAGRHVRIEIPFVIPAIKQLLNPAESLHPLAGLAALAFAANSDGNDPSDPQFEAIQMESEYGRASETWRYFSNLGRGLVPPSIKWPMTLAQLQSPDEVRSLPLDFIDRYKQGTRARSLAKRGAEIRLGANANEFGKYLRDISPDWLYNSLFFGSFERPELSDRELYDRDVMFGNLVKSQMRNLTFGVARLDNMDRQIMTYSAALSRAGNRLNVAKKKAIFDAKILIDPNSPLKEQLGSELPANIKSIVAEQIEIKERLAALKGFYGFYLSEKKNGGTFLDQVRNLFAPESRALTEQEARRENVKRRRSESLIYKNRSEDIRGDYQ
jgi:hypothetical protein